MTERGLSQEGTESGKIWRLCAILLKRKPLEEILQKMKTVFDFLKSPGVSACWDQSPNTVGPLPGLKIITHLEQHINGLPPHLQQLLPVTTSVSI
jgi:hypothetical protein